MPTTKFSNHRYHKVLDKLMWPLVGGSGCKCLLNLAIWRSQVALRTMVLEERRGQTPKWNVLKWG